MLGILGPFGMISRGNLVLTHVARAGARWCVLDIQEMEDLRKDREFFQWEKRDGKHHLSHSFPSFSIVFHHVPQFNQNNRDFETKTRSFMVPIAGSKRAKHGFCKTRWFQSMSGKMGMVCVQQCRCLIRHGSRRPIATSSTYLWRSSMMAMWRQLGHMAGWLAMWAQMVTDLTPWSIGVHRSSSKIRDHPWFIHRP